MAAIIYDKTTKGKFLVRMTGMRGEDIEFTFNTHAEAQAKANEELKWKMRKINGLCPADEAQGSHCSFREGDGWRNNCYYCHNPRK